MTRFSFGWLGVLARASLVAAAAFVAACGSGAVSGPPTSSGTITVTPSSATLYSNVPTTFQLSGGNGSYVVTSNNQSVIALSGTPSASTLTVVPADVTADTSVTLTVSDTLNGTPATATLTVKPRTISNVVTITPSASQSAACGTAVCSGGDAEVKVVMTQNGVPLAGRTVRFDVVSGDVRIITSAAGLPEVDALSGTTISDSTGTASMRIRALSNAGAQTAILQVTDTTSGFTQRASVTVAPGSNAPLTVLPSTIQFTGATSNTCANNISADVIVVGGRPPYQVSQPSGFVVSPQVLTSSGGRVTITATGQCTNAGLLTDPGVPMSLIDSNGASASVTIFNHPAPVTPQTTAFAVAPSAVTLNSCAAIATIALVGGSGSYFAASGNNAVNAQVAGNLGSIQRAAGTNGAGLSTVTVSFSDGQTTKDVSVTLTGAPTGAQGPC